MHIISTALALVRREFVLRSFSAPLVLGSLLNIGAVERPSNLGIQDYGGGVRTLVGGGPEVAARGWLAGCTQLVAHLQEQRAQPTRPKPHPHACWPPTGPVPLDAQLHRHQRGEQRREPLRAALDVRAARRPWRQGPHPA